MKPYVLSESPVSHFIKKQYNKFTHSGDSGGGSSQTMRESDRTEHNFDKIEDSQQNLLLSVRVKTMSDRPIILGIVGDSAAGKTTLTRGIAQVLGPENVTVICTDDYHRYDRKQRAEIGLTALHPDCNYLDIMQQHLSLCLLYTSDAADE